MTQHTPEYLPQMQNPPMARQVPPTAWQSVPKFVRFAVWVYAIATVITVAVVVGGAALLMLAAVS